MKDKGEFFTSSPNNRCDWDEGHNLLLISYTCIGQQISLNLYITVEYSLMIKTHHLYVFLF